MEMKEWTAGQDITVMIERNIDRILKEEGTW